MTTVQEFSVDSNPIFEKLWDEFEKITEVPVVQPYFEGLETLPPMTPDTENFADTLSTWRHMTRRKPTYMEQMVMMQVERGFPKPVEQRILQALYPLEKFPRDWTFFGQNYIMNPNNSRFSSFNDVLKEQLPDSVVSGCFYYPVSCFRSWHTNAMDEEGWRCYFLKTDGGDSWFSYLEPTTGERVSLPDRNRTVRLFQITKKPLLWHSVYSKCDRWSLGIKVGEEDIKRILK